MTTQPDLAASAELPYHALPLARSQRAPRLPMPEVNARLSDPALSLMTSFRFAPCVMADQGDGVDQTLHMMLRARVHMSFVTGVDGAVIGLVTRDDLASEKPVQRALADHVHHEDLRLDHLMTPVGDWQVLERATVEKASVGDVVQTLMQLSQPYLVVIDPHAEGPRLHGLFSARRLEAALGLRIPQGIQSQNFAELGAALRP
ncbi:hypothetical protein HNP55_004391 [Paucibacter oligotrophus]|uniref:CBS domain-containing protein n=1 Tax=Roseateles oligotrophus TaxID=1769250 RepID=A0A840LIN3_9BURK|nr:CBS domain-containing protein [Roseateles oligotrophus]MBB4845839.1 hypothetical protein [Roseateles oligotrophus]